jgi:hypothetical protein
MALRLQRTRRAPYMAQRNGALMRLPATASEARLPCTVSVKGSTRRSPAAIDQHQFLAARVKHLDPDIPTQDNALRVPRPVERDTGHHGAVGIADFQIQHIAPAVKRQGRSRVGRQAEGGDGG